MPRALGNVLSNWSAFVVGAVVSFFLSPLIVHSLGDAVYGAWVLLGSLVGYLGLLDLGVRGAVTQYVARHHAAGRHVEASSLASAAFWVFCTAAVVIVLLSVAMAAGIHAFDVPPELLGDARVALVLAGAAIGVSILSGVFGGIVVGLQRFDALNAVSVVITLVRGLAVASAMWSGLGLVALAAIQLAASAVQGVALVVLSRAFYPELRLRVRGLERRHFRELLGFGLFASLLHVFAMIVNYSDSLVIGAFLSLAMITYFSIAAMLTDYTRQVISGISHTTTPMVGSLAGSERTHEVGDLLIRSARFATLAILPILVTFGLRGRSFIGLWMGPEYADPSGAVLELLALALWPFAGLQVITTGLMGLNRHRVMVWGFVAEALCNLALSLALVRDFGLLGVAVGTLIPRFLLSAVYGPLRVKQELGVALTHYWGAVLLRPAAAMIPFAVASWLLETSYGADAMWIFFAQVAIAFPLAIAGAWFGALPGAERRSYLALLRAGRGV